MFEPLAGNFEMSVGNVTIPAELLGDLTPDYQEGEISAETQAGVITTPSGKPETSQFTFNLFLPRQNAMKYLAVIWPGAYNAPSGESQETGNIEFGSKACQAREPQVYHIHNMCDTTDDNDIHIPAGIARMIFNPTLSTNSAVAIEVTVSMQPDENGVRLRFGTGDLTAPSVYDPTTGTTKPVTATTATASKVAKIVNSDK